MPLTIKPKTGCRWDVVSLGEVMLRFDPGEYRIATTRSFRVSEGGGEYNVARGMKDKPPQGNDAKCGFVCHTIVKTRDYVFTDYGRR